MIPYEELVSALTEWRAQKGLSTTAVRGSARAISAVQPIPAAPVLPYAAAPAALAAAEIVDVAEINSFAPEFDAGDFVESEGTELRDPTGGGGEIDVDADGLDVLDEQDV
jgi:hypothetical protein